MFMKIFYSNILCLYQFNKDKMNKMKKRKDYLKMNLFRTKEYFFNKGKNKKEHFDNHSLNIIRKRNSNNFFFVPKNN